MNTQGTQTQWQVMSSTYISEVFTYVGGEVVLGDGSFLHLGHLDLSTGIRHPERYNRHSIKYIVFTFGVLLFIYMYSIITCIISVFRSVNSKLVNGEKQFIYIHM